MAIRYVLHLVAGPHPSAKPQPHSVVLPAPDLVTYHPAGIMDCALLFVSEPCSDRGSRLSNHIVVSRLIR